MADTKEIKLGELAEISEVDFWTRNKPRKEPQIYFADDLMAIYTAFRDQIYNPQSVLYPSSGFDASPAKVFRNVTFVDKEIGNEGCVAKLQEAGLTALKQDIRQYSPTQEHDLLILLNPSIPTDWASRHLKSGGYVIANDYHGNASGMYRNPNQFTLWGVINFIERDRRKGDNRVVVSRDISDLFVPVKNGEELRRLRPRSYEFIARNFPDILKSMGQEPVQNFEEMYVQFKRMLKESEELPAKRVAERYIFVKD